MPCRNIGWGWHLASPSEIAAWQLEVNKSWSCEKWLPCLLAQSPLPSPPTLSQTTQHVVFTIFYQPSASMEWIDWVKEISCQIYIFSDPRYQNHSKALSKCMLFCVRYLLTFIYSAKVLLVLKCTVLCPCSRCCDKKSCGNRNETPSDPVIIDR